MKLKDSTGDAPEETEPTAPPETAADREGPEDTGSGQPEKAAPEPGDAAPEDAEKPDAEKPEDAVEAEPGESLEQAAEETAKAKPENAEKPGKAAAKAEPAGGGGAPAGLTGRVLRWRPDRRLLAAAAVLVLLTAVITAVLQWRDADRLRAETGTAQLVRTRSAEFGQALLAYRHADLPAARERILGLTSAEFGQTYATAFDALAGVITKYQADATATVRDVYLNEIDGQRAKTLVVLDSEVKSTVGVRRVLGTKLLLELIVERGVWKVAAMRTLPADDDTLTAPDGTTSKPSGDSAEPGAQDTGGTDGADEEKAP